MLYLKLGFTYSLLMEKIKTFSDNFDELYVIEELDPFMEEQIRQAGIPCHGKDVIPKIDELNPHIVACMGDSTFYMVTEYGVANLSGLATWQRAEALINIAHPDMREDLIKAAEAQRIWRQRNKC